MASIAIKNLGRYKNASGQEVFGHKYGQALSHSQVAYRSFNFSPTPSTSALTNGDTLIHRIEPHSCGFIDSLQLEFTITASSNNVTVLPAVWWFNTIEFYANSGSGAMIQRITPLMLMVSYMALLEPSNFKKFGELAGFNEFGFIDTERNTLEAGESRTFTIPLLPVFFAATGLNVNHLSSDLEMRVALRRDGIIQSGSGTVSLTGSRIIVRDDRLPMSDSAVLAKEHKSVPVCYKYLSAEEIKSSQTLTADSKNTITLESLDGDVAGLIVGARSSDAAAAGAVYKWINMGTDQPNARFDLVSADGTSQFGLGTSLPISQQHIIHWRQMVGDAIDKYGVISVPFCHNLGAAFLGMKSGYKRFFSARESIQITPQLGQKFQVTVTHSATPASGAAAFAHGAGGLSSMVAYNASAATCAAAADKLFERYGATTTFSAALDGGVVVSINDQHDRISSKYSPLGVISNMETSGGAVVVTSVECTQRARAGMLSNNQSAEVVVLALQHYECHLFPNGNFEVRKDRPEYVKSR